MTSENFAYWIQGYFEISGNSTLSDTQVQIIKDHLALVFNKVTPKRSQVSNNWGGKVPEFTWSGNPPRWTVMTTGIENMGSTVYTDNHPLVEVSIPHSC